MGSVVCNVIESSSHLFINMRWRPTHSPLVWSHYYWASPQDYIDSTVSSHGPLFSSIHLFFLYGLSKEALWHHRFRRSRVCNRVKISPTRAAKGPYVLLLFKRSSQLFFSLNLCMESQPYLECPHCCSFFKEKIKIFVPRIDITSHICGQHLEARPSMFFLICVCVPFLQPVVTYSNWAVCYRPDGEIARDCGGCFLSPILQGHAPPPQAMPLSSSGHAPLQSVCCCSCPEQTSRS